MFDYVVLCGCVAFCDGVILYVSVALCVFVVLCGGLSFYCGVALYCSVALCFMCDIM